MSLRNIGLVTDEEILAAVSKVNKFNSIFPTVQAYDSPAARRELRERLRKLRPPMDHFVRSPHFMMRDKEPAHFQKKWLDAVSDDSFKSILASSSNESEFCEKAGLPKGHRNTLGAIRARAKRLGAPADHLDSKHMVHQFYRERIEKTLTDNAAIPRGGLQLFGNNLLKFGFLPYRCARCKTTDWRGEPVPLLLRQINGKANDLRLENLEFHCYNCADQSMRPQRIARTVKANRARHGKTNGAA